MVPDGENSHGLFLEEPEEDRVGKSVDEATPHIALHDSKLAWIRKDTIDGSIDLKPKPVAEALPKLVVTCDGAV